MSTPPPTNVLAAPPRSPATPKAPRAARDGDDAGGTRVVRELGGGVRQVISTGEGSASSRGRVSMYVTLFNEMITTVLDSEEYLFTPRELWVLKYIVALPYEAHYLLTRLLLRRPRKVHALGSLVAAYSPEIGEEGVQRAAQTLCIPLDVPPEVAATDAPPESPTPPNLIKNEDTTGTSKPWAGIPTPLSAQEERADPGFAEAIRRSLWEQEVGSVPMDVEDESQDAGPSRPEMSRSESASSAIATPATPQEDDLAKPFSLLPKEAPPITTLAHDESELDLRALMSCISGDDLRRIARARKVPIGLLVTRESVCNALYDIAHKQTTLGFAPVSRKGKERASVNGVDKPCKTTSERLLVAQLLPCLGGHVLQVDPILFALIARVNLIFSRTPPATSMGPALLLPPILVQSQRRHYPDYGAPTRSTIWKDRNELLTWERAVTWEVLVSDSLGDNWAEQRARPGAFMRGPQLSRTDGAKLVRGVWEEAWIIWKSMVAGDRGDAIPPAQQQGGLAGDRFQTGHVLTRIMYKSAEALGVLHEYDKECEVLRALLAQRRWRRGKRGAWYSRLALVLMTHYNANFEQKVAKLEEATQVCIDALLDEDTHLIYRPGLSKRLTRLENRLNLAADERHISYAQLLECETRELVAPRVEQNNGQVRTNSTGSIPRRDSEREASLGLGHDEPSQPAQHQVGKSVWMGRDGEVTVEGWVLEWWEDKGYQGFHAESSILTTLFAILMWPVLFHPLPGAFETKYQTAPLDLGEDSFARARRDLIEERLAAMERTETALEMMREVNARERSRDTWAVGLNWDYGARELEEIVECLGGRALAAICRMLSEEYRHRASGVPDLIVWNYAERVARFVEVKGPGDQLSETQKVWIDVLLSAGVQVEVCRVKAQGDEDKPKARRKSSGGKSGTDKRGPQVARARAKQKADEEPIVIDDSDEGEESTRKRARR